MSPEGRETSSAFGAVKGSLPRESGIWVGHGRLYRRSPAHSQVLKGKTEHMLCADLQMQGKFRCVSSSASMYNWGQLCRALPGMAGAGRGVWGQMESHTKEFGLHPLGTKLLIRRVMQFSLPNCILIVHSLKIKRY